MPPPSDVPNRGNVNQEKEQGESLSNSSKEKDDREAARNNN